MRRVLIVTSSYAPTMIADMQRVRQLAWELPKLGWEVEVLSPSTEYQPATCVDEDSAGFFSPHSQVHCVPEMWPGMFKIAGIGNIGWRALFPLVVCWQAFAAAETFRFDLYLDGSISLVSAWAHLAATVWSAICFGSSRSLVQRGCAPPSLGAAPSQTPR